MVKALDDFEGDLAQDSSRLVFLRAINDDTIEEIVTYNKLLKNINNLQEDDLIEWKFKAIIDHEGLLPMTHPNYNSSPYDLTIQWENRYIANDSFIIIVADDPLYCAAHVRHHNILDEPGCKRIKSLDKREKKLVRLKNQAKLRRHMTTPKCKFRYQIPRANGYEDALSIVKNNTNNKWAEVIQLEIDQQHD